VSEISGTRIEYSGDGLPPNGCYWRDGRDGNWYGMTPNGHLAGLASHNVIEHEDGSITVAPSILVQGHRSSDDGIRVSDGNNRDLWHGYLERGIWREC
jgi:hypothetical protein